MARELTREWLRRNRQALWDCGVPMTLTEDVPRWSYFVEHGTYPGVSIDVSELDPEAMVRLRVLVGEFVVLVAQVTSPPLLLDLERR